MATITFSLSGSGVINGSKSYTLSDADVQSLIDVMTVRYQTTGTPLTPAQALLAWIQGMVDQTIQIVKDSKTRTATNAAAAAVTPIVFG